MKFFTPDVPELFRMTAEGLLFHPKIGELLQDPTYWTTPEAREHAAIAAELWTGRIAASQRDAYRAALVGLYSLGKLELPDAFEPGIEVVRLADALRKPAKKAAKALNGAGTAPRKPRAKKTPPAPVSQAYDAPERVQ